LLFGDIAHEAGLPAGVFNVITGGKDVGTFLTSDRRIKLVTFTGSTGVGAAIMAQAAPTLKKLLLELGGKSAMIVRPDANLAGAVNTGLRGFTSHAGQGCALNTRHIVHNSLLADYIARIRTAAEAVVVGNPADPATQMGPLIRGVARARAEHYTQIGIDSGARLVTGGKRPAHLDKGFFFEPTLFTGLDNSSRLAQEEIFGPIAVVMGYDTDEDAIRIANDSDFGLACYILSADAGRAYEMAQQIDTGRCAINGGAGTQLSDEPFGGNKLSGFGRENGVEGLLEFTNANAISFHAA
jgi:acyl-CoA reductase-like NAD-dependent aldehyde dehydrogenase